MAIHPRYAQAILSGRKTIEFRKRALAPDVRTVLIYETSPTQAIVGEFDLQEHVVESPDELWNQFGAMGGICKADYAAYYAGRPEAIGLAIATARRYNRPVPLSSLEPRSPVPQSFTYIDKRTLERIRACGNGVTRAMRHELARID